MFLAFAQLSFHSFCQFFQPVNNNFGITHQYEDGEYGGGVSFVDWDKNGFDDLTFCQSGSDLTFYRNFDGVLEEAIFPYSNNSEVKMITWVDYDNDNDRDLFITRLWEGPILLRNDGNFIFTDVSISAGMEVTNEWMTYGHAWGDYDRDGFLDLYICTYNGPGFLFPNVTNYLYRNNGDGTFSDVTWISGTSNSNNNTFQAIWTDYDNDQWPDLFLINDRICSTCYDYLYHNNGDGTFTDVSIISNISYDIFSMNAAGDDYDNDNDLDFYVSNNPTGNLLHKNLGDGTFQEVASESGVGFYGHSWSSLFFDSDNDGWQDLHVCSSPFWIMNGQNGFFKNNGDGTFSDNTEEAGFMGDNGFSHSSAVGDFDNDGFFDLAINKSEPSNSMLWHNTANSSYHWLKVTLEGTISNKDGVGTWIKCYSDSKEYVRFTYCGEGYLSQNSFSEIFGLNEQSLVDSLVLLWPSGVVDKWFDLEADQSLLLVEGSSISTHIGTLGNLPLCEGDSIILDAGEFEQYLWNTGWDERYLTVNIGGEYSVEVVNSLGLSIHSDTLLIEVFENPIIQEQISNVSCYGECNGAVSLVITNGAEVSNVFWSNINNNTAQIQELCGDSLYHYLLTDNHGCIAEGIIHVTQPQPLEAGCLDKSLSCFGETVGLDCEASGGTPPYQWLGGPLENVSAGSYLFELMDNNGCLTAFAVEVLSPEELECTIQITNPSLAFGDGDIEAYPSGGIEPYQYEWSTGDSTYYINDLVSGFYGLVVTDANGCEWTDTFVLIYNGIEEIGSNEIQLFPNPASDLVIARLSSNLKGDSVVVNIYNSTGHLIYSNIEATHTNELQIDISNLSNGLYSVVLYTKIGKPLQGSFIKIK